MTVSPGRPRAPGDAVRFQPLVPRHLTGRLLPQLAPLGQLVRLADFRREWTCGAR